MDSGFKCITVGKLTNDVIKTLNLSRPECDILLWEDRYQYIKKHFQKAVSQIPEIIANPDYIAKHPTKNSIEYIKCLDQLLLVAVRIKPTGNIMLRSFYPITQKQLKTYLNAGTAFPLTKNN